MLNHLTPARLATVKQFFQTNNDDDLLGCYVWTQALSSRLLPILGDFEVVLRNTLHRSLSLHYSSGVSDSFDWMMPQPNPARQINPNAPSHLSSRHSLSTQSRENVKTAMANVLKNKPHNYAVTPDDIVAALSFGFWEKLIESLNHHAHPAPMQGPILSVALPHAPVSSVADFATSKFRTQIISLLKRIRDIRNRIGHHDAVWTTPEFNEDGQVGFIPRKSRHTITHMLNAIQKIAWLTSWIDPAIPQYMTQTDHWWALNTLLSSDALDIYRQHGGRAGSYLTLLNQTATHQSNP